MCSATCTFPFPGSAEDRCLYQEFLNRIYDVEIQAVAGDSACDRKYELTGNDVISKKFFDDHMYICLWRGGYLTDLATFCNDFCQGQPLYQVMVITPPELKKLSGHYNQYIPKGTPGNPDATYQIYHGCPPVTSRPGDSASVLDDSTLTLNRYHR